MSCPLRRYFKFTELVRLEKFSERTIALYFQVVLFLIIAERLSFGRPWMSPVGTNRTNPESLMSF
jgi:hypothetical protein